MKYPSIGLACLLCSPLIGWASADPRDRHPGYFGEDARPAEVRYGVIESIESSQVPNDSDSNAGNVIGGVIPRGASRPVGFDCKVQATANMDAAGAPPLRARTVTASGGPAPRQAAYFIRVRLDDQSYQTVAQIGLGDLRVGDGVRIHRYRLRRCELEPIEGGPVPVDPGRKP
jgi:outer membrane lipoprotein SlyB